MSGITYGTTNLAADYAETIGNTQHNDIFILPPVYTPQL
jgi:hypothetical protein